MTESHRKYQVKPYRIIPLIRQFSFDSAADNEKNTLPAAIV